MALDYMRDSIDDLPEVLQKEYKLDTKSGKYYADMPGVVQKEKLDEFRNNNIGLKKQMETIQSELNKFADVDPEKYQEAMVVMQKFQEKQLIDSGDIEGVIANRLARSKTDHDNQVTALGTQIKEKDTAVKSLRGSLNKLRLKHELVTQVGEVAEVKKGALSDVISRAGTVFSLNDPGDGLTPKGPDGEKLFGKDGTSELTVKEWLSGLVETAPHLFQESHGSDTTGHGVITVPAGQRKLNNTGGVAELGNDTMKQVADGQVSIVG